MRDTVTFKTFIYIGLVLVLTPLALRAETGRPERIEWKKAPIRLTLGVGEEQRIEFPAGVKVGVPTTVQPLLRTQSVNGSVYLLAQAPFASSRLVVRELGSGHIYLFDVSAVKETRANRPLQIYVSNDTPVTAHVPKTPAGSKQAHPSTIELTRFAAQQLYAPRRLLKPHAGIVRIPVSRDPVNLVRGGTIEATPLVAWRAGGRYVTAVKLTNRTAHAQLLDPRDLRGRWLTATFQHHRLLPQGDDADTTAVYLISARPFDVSH